MLARLSTPCIHVEVGLRSPTKCLINEIEHYLRKCLRDKILLTNHEFSDFDEHGDDTHMKDSILSIKIAECDMTKGELIDMNENKNMDICFHFYNVLKEVPFESVSEEEGEKIVHYIQWGLPNIHFHGLWESLVFEDDILLRLLKYVEIAFAFSEHSVNTNIITLNRLMFLYGPPGTGKTSICRALANKIACRFSDKYREFKLIEINSHSLFSKYYSESGKLVQSLFKNISTISETDAFVTILIDEVESLTAARTLAMAGNEPSDSIRVVNALLTQIDKLKNKVNVLIMTTSNITDAVDTAFLDRADIIQYIGSPSQQGAYSILTSCFFELMRSGLIYPSVSLMDMRFLLAMPKDEMDPSLKIWRLAENFKGCSGRYLRKLPFLVLSEYGKNGTFPIDMSMAILMFETYLVSHEREIHCKSNKTL